MCSSQPAKMFPTPKIARGDSTLPASVYASTMAPALTDASTGSPLKPPTTPAALPNPGNRMPGQSGANLANPFLAMLARMDMS